MRPFKAMPGYFFFFFLKPKYIISTYVSVSLPRFFILFQRYSGRQRKSGVCTKQGPPAFLMAEQLLLIKSVWFLPHSLVCFFACAPGRLSAIHSPHVLLLEQPSVPRGRAYTECAKHRHTYVYAQTAITWKIS